uniref:F-box domain-containing protein n=1 Tax=Leersia perrieri TaxID=77586 RepID=A0A0D9V286_9ORYZ
MVEEILLRLPEERHLRRARGVCRRYNVIIRRPGFASRHRESHSPLLSGGVILHGVLRRCRRVDSTASHVSGSYAFFLPAASSSSAAFSSLDLAAILPSVVLRYAHFDAAKLEVWDTHAQAQPQWTLVHQATLDDVVRPRSVTAAFVRRHIVDKIHHDRLREHYAAAVPDVYWRSFFTLIGFDPVDDDVFFLGEASENGCVAAYSIRLGKLSFRCKIDTSTSGGGGSSLCACDMFPYARPPLHVQIHSFCNSPRS